MPETAQQVDHRAEARQWLGAADREAATLNLQAAQAFAAVAQVHADLAIAEELKGIREALESSNLIYADGMVRNA
jgi:predicted NodU family carbamoyl transferase